MPSMVTSSAPGMAAAVERPPLTWTILSALPWMTSAGMRRLRSRGVRSPCVRMASIWRTTPLALTPRSKVSPARVRRASGAGGRRRTRSAPTWRRCCRRRRPGRPCAADQPREEGGVLPADGASSGRRADAGQRPHPRRVLDRRSSGRSCRPSTRRRGARTPGRGGRAARRRRRPGRTSCTAPARGRSAKARTSWSRRTGPRPATTGRCRGCRSARRGSRRLPAARRTPGPTTSSGRSAPSPAAAARRRGRRRSGSRARPGCRPGRGARRTRREAGCVSVGRGHVASEHDSRPRINAKWPTSPVGSGFWARFDDCDAAHNGRIPDSGGLPSPPWWRCCAKGRSSPRPAATPSRPAARAARDVVRRRARARASASRCCWCRGSWPVTLAGADGPDAAPRRASAPTAPTSAPTSAARCAAAQLEERLEEIRSGAGARADRRPQPRRDARPRRSPYAARPRRGHRHDGQPDARAGCPPRRRWPAASTCSSGSTAPGCAA